MKYYDKPFVPDMKSEFPEYMPLGMAYVPFQNWDSTYDENTAFCQGTVFPQLDFPFFGEEASDNEQ